MFDEIAILGFGMIGASVARASRKAGIARKIRAWDAVRENLVYGMKEGIVDGPLNPGESTSGLAVVAVPLSAMEEVFAALAPVAEHLEAADLLLTDTGSTKRTVIMAARKAFGFLPRGFIPAHPIAGSERSGARAGEGGLFRGKRVVLTPHSRVSDVANRKVRAFWQTLGASVLTMTPHAHDRILAMTSHLPHLLSYALVNTLAKQDEIARIWRYSAGGLRDFTRIASSNPLMWRDIFLSNKDEVIEILDFFRNDLEELRECLIKKDGAALQAIFGHAKKMRDTALKQTGGVEDDRIP